MKGDGRRVCGKRGKTCPGEGGEEVGGEAGPVQVKGDGRRVCGERGKTCPGEGDRIKGGTRRISLVKGRTRPGKWGTSFYWVWGYGACSDPHPPLPSPTQVLSQQKRGRTSPLVCPLPHTHTGSQPAAAGPHPIPATPCSAPARPSRHGKYCCGTRQHSSRQYDWTMLCR